MPCEDGEPSSIGIYVHVDEASGVNSGCLRSIDVGKQTNEIVLVSIMDF